jgi:low affinity Fe/Cu permease
LNSIFSTAQFATSSLGTAGVLSANVLEAEEYRMNKSPVETKERTVHDHFGRFASLVSSWLGSTWAFVGAGLVIGVWAATGPIFHFSSKWAQVISTGTALLTFLMVFLIQNTQNRDARAINLKLNELIRAMDSARNQMIDIERLTDLELDEMQATYERVKALSMNRRTRQPGDPPAE